MSSIPNMMSVVAILLSLISVVMILIMYLKGQNYEKRDFDKADGTDLDDKRIQLEEDIYRANDRLVDLSTGYNIYQNIDYRYNENFQDISLSKNVLDTSFFEKLGFDINQMAVENDFITCLMPFHPSFNKIYNRIVRAARETGFVSHRSDEVYKSGDIMRYTIELILKSQIVIGVLDGRNPNVFYEVGIAHSVGKTVILIAENNSKNEIPFDLQQHRFIFYTSLNDLQEKLELALKYIRSNKPWTVTRKIKKK